jgi:hypothetical protein
VAVILVWSVEVVAGQRGDGEGRHENSKMGLPCQRPNWLRERAVILVSVVRKGAESGSKGR